MKKTITMFVVACTLGLVAVAAPRDAEAATNICEGGFEWIDFGQAGGNSTLHMGCRAANGSITSVMAQTNNAACSQFNISADTLKLWFSMTSSWNLAGRKVQIYHEPCGGENRITTISLRRQ